MKDKGPKDKRPNDSRIKGQKAVGLRYKRTKDRGKIGLKGTKGQEKEKKKEKQTTERQGTKVKKQF